MFPYSLLFPLVLAFTYGYTALKEPTRRNIILCAVGAFLFGVLLAWGLYPKLSQYYQY